MSVFYLHNNTVEKIDCSADMKILFNESNIYVFIFIEKFHKICT